MSHPIRNPGRTITQRCVWVRQRAETHECDREVSAEMFGEISINVDFSKTSMHPMVVICKYGVSQRTLSITATSAITKWSSPVNIAKTAPFTGGRFCISQDTEVPKCSSC